MAEKQVSLFHAVHILSSLTSSSLMSTSISECMNFLPTKIYWVSTMCQALFYQKGKHWGCFSALRCFCEHPLSRHWDSANWENEDFQRDFEIKVFFSDSALILWMLALILQLISLWRWPCQSHTNHTQITH